MPPPTSHFQEVETKQIFSVETETENCGSPLFKFLGTPLTYKTHTNFRTWYQYESQKVCLHRLRGNFSDAVSETVRNYDAKRCYFAQITLDSFNTDFDNFNDCILHTINTHAPIKTTSRKQKRLSMKPWITKGIFKFIFNSTKQR